MTKGIILERRTAGVSSHLPPSFKVLLSPMLLSAVLALTPAILHGPQFTTFAILVAFNHSLFHTSRKEHLLYSITSDFRIFY